MKIVKIKKRKVSVRCSKCNRKTRLNYYNCKCGKTLCIRHRYRESHDCTYDYKKEFRNKLKDDNPKFESTHNYEPI